LELSAGTLSTQSAGKLSRLLCSALLRLEGSLSPLRSGFKTLSPELSRGPRLLFQHISRALCFLNPLPCAPKRARCNSLCAVALSGDLTLASDVSQRLVDNLLLERAHELCNRCGVVKCGGSRKTRNTLLSGRSAHGSSGLELSGGLARNSPGARNGLLSLLSGSPRRTASTNARLLSYPLSPGRRTSQSGLGSKGRGPCLVCRRHAPHGSRAKLRA